MDALLTLDDAARLLGVSRRTLEREVKAKRLRVLRVGPAGRRIMVEPREVDAYRAARRRAA